MTSLLFYHIIIIIIIIIIINIINDVAGSSQGAFTLKIVRDELDLEQVSLDLIKTVRQLRD